METGGKLEVMWMALDMKIEKIRENGGKESQLVYWWGEGITAPVCSNTRDGSTKCSKKMLLSGDYQQNW